VYRCIGASEVRSVPLHGGGSAVRNIRTHRAARERERVRERGRERARESETRVSRAREREGD